jgi:hypothetical protein
MSNAYPGSFVHATSKTILLFCKDPQDGVVGVDTVENCNGKNNKYKCLAEIQQHTQNLGPYKELQ